MRTLLIGDSSSIALELSKRFILEGDQVHLIGNAEFYESDFPEKVNLYNIDLQDKNAEDVFKVQMPTTVVFFENIQKSYCFDILIEDIQSHVTRFMRAYQLAHTYGVDRFIYISSTDLYEKTQISPDERSRVEIDSYWQDSHYLCEQHILNTKHSIKMTSAVLRISNLYGFNQADEFNPMLIYLSEISSNKRNEYYQNQQYIDFIHIEDFCSAVYKASNSIYSGTLNIASGEYVADEDVKKHVAAIFNGDETSLDDKKISGINVSLAASAIDFVAKHGPDKGIRETVANEIERESSPNSNRKFSLKHFILEISNKMKKNRKAFSLLALFENLLAFALVSYLFLVKDVSMFFGYIDIRVLYILLIGAIFGLRQSAISAALSIALLLYEGFTSGFDLLSVIFDVRTMSAIFIFLLSGLLFGYINDLRRQKLNEIERGELKTREQLIHMKDMYIDSLRVKDHLQDQIFSTKDSMGKLFGAVSQLNSLDFNELKMEIIKVAEGIMNNNSISLYMFGRNRGYMRLISKSGELGEIKKSIVVEKDVLVNSILESKKVCTMDHFDSESEILMGAPIVENGQVIAMLALHTANLEDLTLNYQNLFEITANLVSQAIFRSYEYQKTQEDVWYIEGTNIMKKEYFKKNLDQKIRLGDESEVTYVVLEIDNEIDQKLYEDTSRYLREFDYIGIGENGKLSVILNDTNINEAQIVQERLSSYGIITKVMREKS